MLLRSGMLTKIDRYILKSLLITFVFSLLLFSPVIIAIDASEKADEFVRSGLSTLQIIRQYHFGFVPYIVGMLYPLFAFIATIFFTSKMAARSEIVATLAAGTSFNRFLRPYFIGGLFLAAVIWYGNAYVIPDATKLRGTFQAKYLDKGDPAKNVQPGNYRRSDTNTYIGMRYYDTASKTAGNFFMHKITSGKVSYNLRASSMQWDTATKAWKLTDVTERFVSDMKEKVTQYPTMSLRMSIKPEDLRSDYYLKDKLTTPQLKKFIVTEELRGTEGLSTLKVELYRRTATAFSVLLLTLIGAVIGSRKTRGGSGLHLLLGVVIAAVFIISDKFSTTFAIKGNFHPLLAAWVPNIVFTAVAYWLYRLAPK